jgi:CRISPR-associated protein Cas2
MKKSVRERVWKVMLEWAELVPEDGGVVIVWRDRNCPSGLSMRTLGWPKKEFIEHEGTWLTVGNLREVHYPEELERLAAKVEDE